MGVPPISRFSPHREGWEDIFPLRDIGNADPCSFFRVNQADIFAGKENRPFLGFEEPEAGLEKSGLPRAIGADDADNLRRFNVDGDPVKNFDLSITRK